MLSLSRAVLLVAAVGLAVGGLVAIGSGGGGLAGIWLLVSAGAIAVAVAFERTRYRSEEEETKLEARFRPTGEVFVDPTSGRRMRVFADGATGERRYRDDA